MNTPLSTRLMSFSFAALVTLSMLAAVNTLATSEPAADQLARVMQPAQA